MRGWQLINVVLVKCLIAEGRRRGFGWRGSLFGARTFAPWCSWSGQSEWQRCWSGVVGDIELDVISKVVELKSMTADYVANREHVCGVEEGSKNLGDHLGREEQSGICSCWCWWTDICQRGSVWARRGQCLWYLKQFWGRRQRWSG